jgi:hypothetical protein
MAISRQSKAALVKSKSEAAWIKRRRLDVDKLVARDCKRKQAPTGPQNASEKKAIEAIQKIVFINLRNFTTNN